MKIKKIQAFTIVELVIVILVIGILSAVALPRLVNLSGQARKSNVSAVAGNLKVAVELAHADWVASSEPKQVLVDNVYFWMGEGVSAPGWPQNVSSEDANTDVSLTPNECLKLWNKLMKNPPLASTTSGCTANNTCKFYVTQSEEVCTFTDKDNNYITYDRSTGEVTDNYAG